MLAYVGHVMVANTTHTSVMGRDSVNKLAFYVGTKLREQITLPPLFVLFVLCLVCFVDVFCFIKNLSVACLISRPNQHIN